MALKQGLVYQHWGLELAGQLMEKGMGRSAMESGGGVSQEAQKRASFASLIFSNFVPSVD